MRARRFHRTNHTKVKTKDMSEKIYDPNFYQEKIKSVGDSADVVVPLLIKLFQPKSVVDFGSGIGVWLAAFKKNGVPKVQGLDGDWVTKAQLKIAPEEFTSCNLEKCTVPSGAYDLALSLEVGEHLPAASAIDFVKSITNASDVVVFSAAIPFQGGSYHVNEQWPDYWAQLFETHGFQAYDIVRPLIWDLPGVEPHYAQNIIVYVKASRALGLASILGLPSPASSALRKIHPQLWESKMHEALDFTRFGSVKLLKAIPMSLLRSISARFGK